MLGKATAAAWHGLTPQERAQLVLVARRDGRDPDPYVESRMPEWQLSEYTTLMRFGMTVLVRLRPQAMWLEAVVDRVEVEVELLTVRRSWAADCREFLDHAGPDSEVLHDLIEADGPSVTDLGGLRRKRGPLVGEDLRAKVTIARAAEVIHQAWPVLVALEVAVPEVRKRFLDREFADSLLPESLVRSRRRLSAAHEELQRLVGPVELPAPSSEAIETVERVLRSAR